jgi:hypothetical protein
MSDARARRSRGSSDIQQQVSKPVSDTPIDATTLRVRQLRNILDNQLDHRLLLHDLDFVDLHDETLRELFVPPEGDKRKFHLGEDGSIMLPPKARRRSLSQINEFFKLGPGQKRKLLEEYKDWAIDRSGFVSYTDSPYCVSLQEPEKPLPVAVPVAAAVKSPEQISSTGSLPPFPVKCGGINIQYLKTGMRLSDQRFDEYSLGFADTYRESLMTRVRFENPRNPFCEWDFAPNVLGALSSGSDKYRMVWTCQEIKDGTSKPFLMGNAIDFGCYTFKHVDCSDEEGGLTGGLCKQCLKAKPLLLRRFINNKNLHSAEFNPKRNKQYDKTPSLMNERTIYYATKYKQVTRRLSYRTKALEKLIEDTGVECPINEDSNSIFDISMEDNVKRFLSRDPNIARQLLPNTSSPRHA